MRTQTSLENNRRWVVIGAQALFIAYSLVSVAYGYSMLLEIVTKNGWPFARPIAIFVISLCIMPGFVVWKVLRPRTKYAAIYGLLVAAIFCTIPKLLE